MKDWGRQVLNKLIDKYERSSLYYKTNKRNQSISLRLSKKELPEYFNNSSLDFEDINDSLKTLEEKGFIKLFWKGNKKDFIIEKVVLNLDRLNQIYPHLKRQPKSLKEKECLKIIKYHKEKFKNLIVTSHFLDFISKRILEGKPVKKYLDLNKLGDFKDLIKALGEIEGNKENYYIREFSIKLFGNSKRLEKFIPIIKHIFINLNPEKPEESENFLEEHFIFKNPNYIYLKGDIEVSLGEEIFNLSLLKQGLAFSGEDLEKIHFRPNERIKKVLTIENLTSFNRVNLEDSLIIYLGGFHNKNRRDLLKKLKVELPGIEFLHFGDIDIGGFEIYRDLIKKTEINFIPFKMGISELEKYQNYSKKLTQNDNKRLEKLRENLEKEGLDTIIEVLNFMKEKQIKLEQEVISLD